MLYLAGLRRASSGVGLLVVQLCCACSTPCCTAAGERDGGHRRARGRTGRRGITPSSSSKETVRSIAKPGPSTGAAATAWSGKGEEELDAPGALDQAKTEDPTLSAGDRPLHRRTARLAEPAALHPHPPDRESVCAVAVSRDGDKIVRWPHPTEAVSKLEYYQLP